MANLESRASIFSLACSLSSGVGASSCSCVRSAKRVVYAVTIVRNRGRKCSLMSMTWSLTLSYRAPILASARLERLKCPVVSERMRRRTVAKPIALPMLSTIFSTFSVNSPLMRTNCGSLEVRSLRSRVMECLNERAASFNFVIEPMSVLLYPFSIFS